MPNREAMLESCTSRVIGDRRLPQEASNYRGFLLGFLVLVFDRDKFNGDLDGMKKLWGVA